MYVELKDSYSERTSRNGSFASAIRNQSFSAEVENSVADMSFKPHQFSINDLDRFFFSLYKYWYEGGYKALLVSHISHLILLGFTIFFPTFLILYVNWKEILFCSTKEVCSSTPFFQNNYVYSLNWSSVLFAIYLLFPLLGLFTWHLIVSCWNIIEAKTCHRFVRDILHIKDEKSLRILDWVEIVAILLKAQEVFPFCRVEMNMTAMDIAQIIMRQDNYLIALTNRGLVTKNIPKWLPESVMYSKVILWNFRVALFTQMFDRRYRITLKDYFPLKKNNSTRSVSNATTRCSLNNSQQLNSIAASRLASNFRLLAFVNFFMMIPSLLFVIVYFILKYVQDFRINASIPFVREFNCYAFWSFREFNELPHQLERRMSSAAFYTENYVNSLWYSPVIQRLKMSLKYVLGALLAGVALPFLFFDETPLFHVKFGSRNLMWYIVILGSLFTFVRNYTDSRKNEPDDFSDQSTQYSWQLRNMHYLSPLELYKRFMHIIQYTHYFPTSWRCLTNCMEDKVNPNEKNSEYSMHNDFYHLHELIGSEICQKFFCIRLTSLFGELLGVFAAPIVLLFYLPSAANEICDIIFRSTYKGTTGDFCIFGNLDISQNGNPFYNAPECSFLSSLPSNNCSGISDYNCNLQTINGKLEKSLLTFLLYYRLPPIDDTSPMWSVFGIDELVFALEDFTQSEKLNETEKFDGIESYRSQHLYNYTSSPLWQKWGYSQIAVDFLHRLEIFQKEQLAEKPILCRILPPDLCLSLFSLNSSEESNYFKLTGPPPLNEKAKGIFFFWLEKLYEIKSGRQFNPTSHLSRLFALQTNGKKLLLK